MRICLACLTSNSELLQHFYYYPSLKEWLLSMLLKVTKKFRFVYSLQTPEPNIRQETASTIHTICIQTPEEYLKEVEQPLVAYFVNLLVSFLPSMEAYSTTCEQVLHSWTV